MLQGNVHVSRIVVALICVWGLSNVRLAVRSWRDFFGPSQNTLPAVFIPRFEPLAAFLPADATVGYFLDREHADTKTHHPNARLALAQYCLSPRIIAETTDCGLVIADSDAPETPPALARQRGWRLVADLHNGVRLYRTEKPAP